MSESRPIFDYEQLEREEDAKEIVVRDGTSKSYYFKKLGEEQEKREEEDDSLLVSLMKETSLTHSIKTRLKNISFKNLKESYGEYEPTVFLKKEETPKFDSPDLKNSLYKKNLRRLQAFDSEIAQVILEEKSKKNFADSKKLEEKVGISFEKTPHIMVSALLDQERNRLVQKYNLKLEGPDEKGNMTFTVESKNQNKKQAQIAAVRAKAIEDAANRIRNSPSPHGLDLDFFKKELEPLKQSMKSTTRWGSWFKDHFVTSKKNIDKIIEVAKENMQRTNINKPR